MSSGERSCKFYGMCPVEAKDDFSCNVDCPEYKWDEKTKPDSKEGCSQILKDLLG